MCLSENISVAFYNNLQFYGKISNTNILYYLVRVKSMLLLLCCWVRLIVIVCSSGQPQKKRISVLLTPPVIVFRCSALFLLYISILHPLLPLLLPSPALRSPMSVPPGSYPAHFGVVSHAGLNGELASPGGFGGALTLSPQISAAASAYSRSPMVSKGQLILLCLFIVQYKYKTQTKMSSCSLCSIL